MLKILAIILNVLLSIVGLLSLLQFNLCGILAGLGAGIPNLILLSRGSVEGATRYIGVMGNTAAIIIGIVSFILAMVAIFGESTGPEAAAGWILLVFSGVFFGAGILTAIVIANEFGVGR